MGTYGVTVILFKIKIQITYLISFLRNRKCCPETVALNVRCRRIGKRMSLTYFLWKSIALSTIGKLFHAKIYHIFSHCEQEVLNYLEIIHYSMSPYETAVHSKTPVNWLFRKRSSKSHCKLLTDRKDILRFF